MPKPEGTSDTREPVIEQHVADELDRYRGKWVALDDDRIVGAGDSVVDALNAARREGVTDPVVFRVPVHPDRLSFL